MSKSKRKGRITKQDHACVCPGTSEQKSERESEKVREGESKSSGWPGCYGLRMSCNRKKYFSSGSTQPEQPYSLSRPAPGRQTLFSFFFFADIPFARLSLLIYIATRGSSLLYLLLPIHSIHVSPWCQSARCN